MDGRVGRVTVLALTLIGACAEPDAEAVDGRDDAFLGDGKADAFGVVDGSPEACAVLRLVTEATYDELRGITNPAAINIEHYRLGPDTTWHTDDDRRIDTLVVLDAIPYVGPAAFGKLLVYAGANYACAGAPEPEPVDATTCSILRAANESSVDELDDAAGLDRRAATAIVGAQPIATLEALDALPYVGTTALGQLRAYAEAEGLTCAAAPACAGTGGTFDGVTFSAAQECRVIDFINRARLSQMATLGATLRHYVYDCELRAGALDCDEGRARAWTRLAELDPFVAATSMNQLKTASGAWVDDGRPSDTIASLWAERTALLDKPVGLDKVFVVRRTNPTSQTRYCYELRDTPAATNYLTACVWYVASDAAPPCSRDNCLDPAIGSYVGLRGTLKAESFAGGVGITVAPTLRPTAPRD